MIRSVMWAGGTVDPTARRPSLAFIPRTRSANPQPLPHYTSRAKVKLRPRSDEQRLAETSAEALQPDRCTIAFTLQPRLTLEDFGVVDPARLLHAYLGNKFSLGSVELTYAVRGRSGKCWFISWVRKASPTLAPPRTTDKPSLTTGFHMPIAQGERARSERAASGVRWSEARAPAPPPCDKPGATPPGDAYAPLDAAASVHRTHHHAASASRPPLGASAVRLAPDDPPATAAAPDGPPRIMHCTYALFHNRITVPRRVAQNRQLSTP
ncbi:unnamed protein product [Chilo suppressalis]|uniref:Uncharacterized protein n=1 Tax=Chilo suppressalis TaxID=168631 RepID=A0ABN8B1C0_CHISP|nr:unnamed protein product [Chilo suppressalis]